MNKIWTDEVSDMLRAHIEGGLSYGRAADALNSRFNLAITRHAAIGRGYRIGLVPPKREPKPKIPKIDRPKRSSANHHSSITRIVAANGNSNHLRVITTRESVEQYKLRCVEIVPRSLTLIELEPGDCRYPYGDEASDIRFCGHPSRAGSSYCEPHYHLTRKVPEPRRDQARLWNAA